jgi:Fe-S-cluster containining protein
MDCYSFQCTACGKCCNSPPQLSIPELFHHQTLFVGSVAIRRVQRYQAKMRVGSDVHAYELNADDARAFRELSDQLLFRVEKPFDSGYDFAIITQGFHYSSQQRCPALGDDEKCAIYQNKQPTTCSAVPMDALVPDHLQHSVLARRKHEAQFLSANCIIEGPREGFTLLTELGRVADLSFQAALAQRRRDMVADKQWWGKGVFEMLRKDLFASPFESVRLPLDGFFSLSLVPVLMVLADISMSCRERCVEYIDAQLALIDQLVQKAIKRQRSEDKATTQQLRAWANAYRALRKSLASNPLGMAAGLVYQRDQSSAEAWLMGA